jgi:hypothetical protein
MKGRKILKSGIHEKSGTIKASSWIPGFQIPLTSLKKRSGSRTAGAFYEILFGRV